MKGLSLTLTIVIIAIVLLVTALVIMTMFGGSMANIARIFRLIEDDAFYQNLCQQQCSAWCSAHIGEEEPQGGYLWTAMGESGKITTSDGTVKQCSQVMAKLNVATCKCT